MDLTIEPIASINMQGLEALAETRLGTEPSAAVSTRFGALLEEGTAEIERNVHAAEAAARDMAAGKPVDLHEVMISLEKASLSVQVFLQVRNKLVESYQDLMRMQM